MQERLGLRLTEAARALGVSTDTLRQSVRRAEIAHYRIGSRLFVPVAEIERLTRAKVGGDQQ